MLFFNWGNPLRSPAETQRTGYTSTTDNMSQLPAFDCNFDTRSFRRVAEAFESKLRSPPLTQ